MEDQLANNKGTAGHGGEKIRSRALLGLESPCAIRAEASAFCGIISKFEQILTQTLRLEKAAQ